jgi:hypothetical protein
MEAIGAGRDLVLRKGQLLSSRRKSIRRIGSGPHAAWRLGHPSKSRGVRIVVSASVDGENAVSWSSPPVQMRLAPTNRLVLAETKEAGEEGMGQARGCVLSGTVAAKCTGN